MKTLPIGILSSKPGNLPLNIFEDRYLQLVSDCMKENRIFGMIQPKDTGGKKPDVYSVGGLGKIINFNETEDKRFIRRTTS